MQKLNAEKIYLKILDPEDVTQKYVDWMNNYEITKYTESRFSKHTLESTISFVKYASNESNHLFGIFDIATNEHIGNIKLGNINKFHKYADIGLIVGNSDYWGKGVASASIGLVTRFGFEDLKLHKIFAGIYENNIGSKRAFEKNGYALAYIDKLKYLFENQYINGLCYEKFNENE